jgi:hypothetical protein
MHNVEGHSRSVILAKYGVQRVILAGSQYFETELKSIGWKIQT